MNIEHDIAKKLFEMTQVYLPWRARKKFLTWEELPDNVKHIWFEKAIETINIIKIYCPFNKSFGG